MALVVTALGACGDEGPAEQAGATVDEQREQAASDGQAQRSGDGGGADQTPALLNGCAFTAPPGRLAEARIPIDLDGAPCDQAVTLARAAALGQPAGANLTIEARGYRCEPSTETKGANVTYTCAGDDGSASFSLVWSESER